jgi:hypothetical protein
MEGTSEFERMKNTDINNRTVCCVTVQTQNYLVWFRWVGLPNLHYDHIAGYAVATFR